MIQIQLFINCLTLATACTQFPTTAIKVCSTKNAEEACMVRIIMWWIPLLTSHVSY